MEANVSPYKAQRNYLRSSQLFRPASVWIVMIAALASAQENRPTLPELNLPHGPVRRLGSPDGSRILYGVPYQNGVNDGPQLWIEDTRTHQRKILLSVGGTLSAVWSSDG